VTGCATQLHRDRVVAVFRTWCNDCELDCHLLCLLAFTARLELVFWKYLARRVGQAAWFTKGAGGDTLLA